MFESHASLPRKRMKASTVYQREEKVFCHSMSETTEGFWLLSEPVTVAPAVDAAAIGKDLQGCLAASRAGVPHPTDFKDVSKPLFALAGVKSATAFSTNAKSVLVEQDEDGAIKLYPTRNGGRREGYIPLMDKIITITDGEGDLGQRVIEALERSE